MSNFNQVFILLLLYAFLLPGTDILVLTCKIIVIWDSGVAPLSKVVQLYAQIYGYK